MDSSIIPDEVNNLLFEALSPAEGIGVFDAEDRLVFCNEILASAFSLPVSTLVGMTFDEIIEHNFNSKTGLNIESDSLSSWLDKAHKLRRSEKYRRFDLDDHAGRWYLVREYTAKDESILMVCSDITERKRDEVRLSELNRKLTILANLDPLTGIFNRRYFYESAEIELSRSTRQQQKVSVLMIDLDYFKSINDRFGHEGGDKVLVETTTQIREVLRTYDIFGRIGGEEFAVLLPGSSLAEAVDIGERIINQLRGYRFSGLPDDVRVTASIGAAEYKNKETTLDKLIRSADLLLYQAKKSGRDRIKS